MSPAARRPIVSELDAINGDMKNALLRDELDAWAQADDRFHRTLIDRSGNMRLARLANTIMDQSHRARMMTLRLRAKPTKSIKEHQAITAAIKNGDPMLSCSNAQDHRRRARSELLPLLDQFGMKHL